MNHDQKLAQRDAMPRRAPWANAFGILTCSPKCAYVNITKTKKKEQERISIDWLSISMVQTAQHRDMEKTMLLVRLSHCEVVYRKLGDREVTSFLLATT